MMRVFAAFVVLLFNCDLQAQQLPAGTILLSFDTTGELRSTVEALTLPLGDPTSEKARQLRLEAFQVESTFSSRSLHSCDVLGRGTTKCVVSSSGFFLSAKPPYEPFSHLLASKICCRETLTTEHREPIVIADSQVSKRLPRPTGFDDSAISLYTALAPLVLVQNGETAWSNLQRLADSGSLIECRKDRVCSVVVRVGARDAPDIAPLISVCQSPLVGVRGSASKLGPLRDCEILASHIDGVKRLLAITEIETIFGRGGGHPQVVTIRGVSEAKLKEALVLTMRRMGVALDNVTKNKLVGEGLPTLDRRQNAYIGRYLAVDYILVGDPGAAAPAFEWWINLEIWIHEYILNRLDRPTMRRDLEKPEKARFVDELRMVLAACRTSDEKPFDIDCS